MSSDSTESKQSVTPLLYGFGLWWAWYDFFRIADSHLLPGPTGAIEMDVARALISLGFNAAALVIALCYRRIGSLLDRKRLLATDAVIAVALSIVFYSPLATGTPLPGMPLVMFLLGLSSVPLFMAWFELYARISSGTAGWNGTVIPLSLLLNGVALLTLLIFHFFLPPLPVALLHIALIGCSYAALIALVKQAKIEPAKILETRAPSFVLPRQLLLALFAFGFLFGLVMNLTPNEAPESHTGAAVEIAGILLSACTFLGYWILSARKRRESLANGALSLRHVIVPFMVLGIMLLPLLALRLPYVANAVFWAGYDYLDILMMFMYTEMARRLAVSPLAINAQGQFADSFGITVGMVAGITLWPLVASLSNGLAIVSIIAVMLIIFISQRVMSDRNLTTLWGLAKEDARSHRQMAQRDAIAALAKRYQLTAREEEVVGLLYDGKRPEQIAQKFTISVKTVRSHIYRIYNKLDVHSHQELIECVEAASEVH